MPRGVRVTVSTCAASTYFLCNSCTTILLITMVISMFTVAGAPVDDPQDKVENYLTQFGYLPEAKDNSLNFDEQLHDAIRNLQDFAGLPVTGEITEETKRLMSRRRCGLPDVIQHHYRNKRYTLHGQKWHHNNLSWSLTTWANYLPPELQAAPLRRELQKAFDIWSRHSKLTFREIPHSNSVEADILIKFERGDHQDGYAFDGRGQVLAHAFFPGINRGGDAHFDADELWLLEGQEDEDGTSVLAVAAHEFGHSLGLAHSSVQGALMFPWYAGIPDNFELPDDDRVAIEQLYGRREIRWGVINETPVHRWNPPRPETTRRPYRPRPTTTTRRPARPGPVSTTTTQRPRRTTTKRIMHSNPKLADAPFTCKTTYDAISVIGREVFIFKDRYFWRLNDRGPQDGYPAEIHRLWPQLPKHMKRVDAVYERMDKKIVFFIGREYYVFQANQLEWGYPRPLTYLGLPTFLDHVDGTTVWGHNNRTYIFAGNLYWRLDSETGRAELDYPRNITSTWKGVGGNIDAVFKWIDDKTYFFKGYYFWKLNDHRLEVGPPKSSAEFWMKCPPPRDEDEIPPLPPLPTKQPSTSDDLPTKSSSSNIRLNILSLIIFIISIII